MSAAELLAEVRADPAAPLRAAICAPGGFGKSMLLAELEQLYGDQAVLVDDAHRLGDARLQELRELAERPDARIVVAYRPWPRPPALVPLTEVLRRRRAPIVLPALTTAEIGELAGFPLAEYVAALSGGVPRYVARLAAALPASAVPGRVPATALAPFAPEIDELDAGLRTLLLAAEAGAGLSFDLIAKLLGREPRDVAELVAAGQATGMLGADGTMIPLARHALAALAPIAERIDVRQRLAGLQLARGGPVLPLVRHLLPEGGDGARPELGHAFEAAGEEALGDDPALAARLFAAAAEAGRPAAARHAMATALAGDLDLAARLADRALTDRSVTGGSPAQRAESAYVSAVAMAHRGRLESSAELLRWAGPGTAASLRAAALTGAGRPEEADEVLARLDAGDDGPPTLLQASAALMARGVRESVTGTPAAALSTLVQASTLLEPAGAGLLPDSPAALAAIVALHDADLDTAEATLDRAIRSTMGGPPLAARHLLLQAWSRMLRGHLGTAARLLAEARTGVDAPALPGDPGGAQAARGRTRGVDAPALPGDPGGAQAARGRARDAGPPALLGRDLLFATALRVGLARRDSDPVGLRAVWPDACQVLISQPVDLFTLLPLGELTVAAARLGEQDRVAAQLAEADRLLARLGDPPLWSVPLHWSRLHAAILAERPEEAERHATALAENAGRRPYAEALALAATGWLAVITDRIDPERIEAAARGLAATGLAWDGARLAGQAAIRTGDRKAMTWLLDCARLLGGPAAEPRETETPSAEPLLSEREQQVAALVVAGLTYKQVAEQLYLSAKTVEHHVARIRQRLGCTDRRELLARLRELLPEQPADRPNGAMA
ncbi:LuxR C-terminal-related transcriptional regulator [Actinoplanes sp. CA-142083]|uniref:LuxR C-terminal-related transcriptional regulator n=1 Tax=Actinoplanes sp. CA-142083 TaxID=3239903 RepID=UPI003D8D09A8